jgi:endonuclease III-like uncharacterized protein
MNELEQREIISDIVKNLETFKQNIIDKEESVDLAFTKIDDLEDVLSNIGDVEWSSKKLKEEIVLALIRNTNFRRVKEKLSDFRKQEFDERYGIIDNTLSYLSEIEYFTTIKDVLNYTDHVLQDLKEMVQSKKYH